MPKKTNEKKELKEEKTVAVTKNTKTAGKKQTNKPTKGSKTISNKKDVAKTSEVKTTAKKTKTNIDVPITSKAKTQVNVKREQAKNTVKKSTAIKTESKAKIDKSEKKKEEIIKEETVIEKIKNFIAKIVAMQEEARLEAEAAQIEKNYKKENIVKEKEENKPTENTPYMLEYYDLPYRYNETVVKILAQTPKKLFVYWDISDNDREKYLKAFGQTFFEDTYPVLLVHNEDKNYTFEVSINDFANSWYLDIKDPKSKYVIELGRKFRTRPEIVNIVKSEETKDIVLRNDYVPIITSNVLEVPNDCILFKNTSGKILYRNVKNNKETFVDIKNSEVTKNMEHIYSIYDFYKEFYKDEIKDENMLDLLNPSSMSSSTFK